MSAPPIEMLWESTDAEAALARRFGFASSAAAADWLTATLERTHGLVVRSVDRLVISDWNVMAWLRTPDEQLVVKCSGNLARHPSLSAQGELLGWLHQTGVPVSAPLPDRAGRFQVLEDHLTFGVQRQQSGDHLSPSEGDQARTAGEAMAALHEALAQAPADLTCKGDDPLEPPHAPRTGLRPSSTFRELPATDYRTDLENLHPRLRPAAQLALDQIERRTVDASPAQLIHNDIRSVNLLVVEERISAILDFEEIATGRRVDDVAKAAVMLNTRFREWQPAPWAAQQSFLEGYRSRHPLSSAEELLLVPLMLWNSIGQASSALGRRGETAWLEAVDRLADQLG